MAPSAMVGTWREPTASHYIAGEWTVGAGGPAIPNENPADTRDVLGSYPVGTEADVRTATAAATCAQPEWAAMSPVTRGRLLQRIARVIEQHTEAFACDLTREGGKTLPEARAEVLRAAAVFDYYGALGHSLGGKLNPSERPGFRSETRRIPLGVVSVITPWNFPIAIPAWKSAPALVAGNAVVLKPAPATPQSAVNLFRAAEAAGIPAGVFQLVQGDAAVGGALIRDENVRAVAFTGSTAVGTQIYRDAAQSLIPLQAEMGGNNALVVLDDADLGLAVQIAIEGGFWSAGQKCTATRRILVHQAVAQEFNERTVAATRDLVVGDPMDPRVRIGPLISGSQLAMIEAGVQAARDEGAQVLFGGARLRDGELAHGHFFEPTILTHVPRDGPTAREELFGPVVRLFTVADLEEAVDLANDTPYGLSAAICTSDIDRAERFAEASQTGVVAVNAPTAGIDVQAPLRGVKGSGLGLAETGTEALEFFLTPKVVYLRHRDGDR